MLLRDLVLLYYRAAALLRSYKSAYARAEAHDIIVSRRVRLDLPVEQPGRSRRACGARAARVSMDRACAVATARGEARGGVRAMLLFDPDEARAWQAAATRMRASLN